MDIDSMRQSPIGSLTPITAVDPRTFQEYSHFAFLPAPLPEEIDLSQQTWTGVAAATGAIGQLKQVCAQLPNPELLIAPALAKEAQATSALEGTYGALPDVLEARLPGFEPRSPEIREIHAYERMARMGFAWITDRPITTSMLCDLQRVLAEASRHRPPEPGRVRTHQVVIGSEDSNVVDARFVPPPPGDHLRDGLEAWQRWVSEDHDLPVVVRGALAHYQFETLHPFGDANGRVGRLVILLQLLRDGALTAPSLTISPWLLRRRDQYVNHLLEVSRTGDWNPWVAFFCEGVRQQCESHVDVAARLLDWMSGLRHTLDERRWTGVIVRVADSLIDWPVLTANSITQVHECSRPMAQNVIDRLVSVGALTELTGRNYGRVYGARDVMTMVEAL